MENLNELKEIITERGLTSIVLEKPDYVTAIIGITDEGNIVYNYDDMVDFLMENDKMSEEEAMDFISYNTIRAIPYMNVEGAAKPIIVYPVE